MKGNMEKPWYVIVDDQGEVYRWDTSLYSMILAKRDLERGAFGKRDGETEAEAEVLDTLTPEMRVAKAAFGIRTEPLQLYIEEFKCMTDSHGKKLDLQAMINTAPSVYLDS